MDEKFKQYGEEVKLTKNKTTQFADFSITHCGSRKNRFGNTDQIFRIAHQGTEKKITWGPGTGLIVPAYFFIETRKLLILKEKKYFKIEPAQSGKWIVDLVRYEEIKSARKHAK